MAFKLQSGRSKSGENTKFLGHISLEVERYDFEKNAVEGINIVDGSAMRIRMPSVEEFAALHVNRNNFDTDEKRLTEAKRQTKKQPTVESMAEKVKVGAVMQMQNVKIDRNGDNVARWMKGVTTDPANQAGLSAMIEINVPRDENEDNPTRNAIIVQVDEAFRPSSDNLDAISNALSNNAEKGMSIPFDAKTGLTVAASTGEENMGFRLMTGWDKTNETPITGLEANVTRPAYDNREAMAQTLLAASVGIKFDDLKEPVNAGEYDRDYHAGLYDAVTEKEVQVGVAPTITGRLMQFVREDVMDGEMKEKAGKGAKLSNRGYFPAHIGLEQGSVIPDSNSRYPTSVRQVLQAEAFLKPTTDKTHSAVWSGEIAGRITDVASTKEAELEAAKAKTNDQSKDRSADMGQPSM